MIQIKILYNDGILLPKICILKVHLFPGLHSFDEYSNNTSKELLEQFSGWEEEERGYLTFVKKEVSLFPRDLKNRIGAPLAESRGKNAGGKLHESIRVLSARVSHLLDKAAYTEGSDRYRLLLRSSRHEIVQRPL